jgi:hypothetical protein
MFSPLQEQTRGAQLKHSRGFHAFEDGWLQHIAPVHWDHMNLTGNYA